MARKKTVQSDNMTLTSELPDDAIKDITGEDIDREEEMKPKTMSQAQSAALAQIPDDKPAKKDIFNEDKKLVNADSKQVFECMSYLNKLRLKPSFGINGNLATCVIVDTDGNTVMPMNELTQKPTVAFGNDKDRALINAVNGYKAHAPELEERPYAQKIEEKTGLKALPMPSKELPESPFSPGCINNVFPPAIMYGGLENSLLAALRDYIHQQVNTILDSREEAKAYDEAESNDSNYELKEKITELLRKL